MNLRHLLRPVASATATSVRRPVLHVRLRRAGVRVNSTRGPGKAQIGELSVDYSDPLVLYIEHKDIFRHCIYSFPYNGPSPRILDCGGHFGLATLFFKSRFPGARITVFEPDPAVLPMLETNLRANGYADVEIVAKALSGNGNTRSLVSDLDGSRLTDSNATELMSTDVETTQLTSYLGEPIQFLKMNIEGAELEVLESASAQLRSVERMVIEYHGFADRPQYLHRLLEVLNSAGFRYGVHDFDAITNETTKPPFFRDTAPATYFLLVYAERQGS